MPRIALFLIICLFSHWSTNTATGTQVLGENQHYRLVYLGYWPSNSVDTADSVSLRVEDIDKKTNCILRLDEPLKVIAPSAISCRMGPELAAIMLQGKNCGRLVVISLKEGKALQVLPCFEAVPFSKAPSFLYRVFVPRFAHGDNTLTLAVLNVTGKQPRSEVVYPEYKVGTDTEDTMAKSAWPVTFSVSSLVNLTNDLFFFSEKTTEAHNYNAVFLSFSNDMTPHTFRKATNFAALTRPNVQDEFTGNVSVSQVLLDGTRGVRLKLHPSKFLQTHEVWLSLPPGS